ncbi:type VII secretion protein EssC [Ornithinibacillus halotolerans]|uniref:Type VII secretion protein EssC n=1 Tax=Ornithinibacillus halotolerans TaxID=1274357 RepID=A0A916S3A0_9BACI|nr:type VII secretion protein EssC [Ornithinibacillus halotolerans]GGA79767.1 type VII secretion protein EssC [Ornithinibacillus halotolerans]
MLSRYKLIISNRNLYKEVEIASDTEELRIGTGLDCDVRLRKELFFGQVELTLTKHKDNWNLLVSDNLYLSLGDVRKLMNKELHHGDELVLKYQESGNEVFTLSFMIDFDYEKKAYNRVIDIADVKEIRIGGDASCDISIRDDYLGTDSMTLSMENGKWFVTDNNTKYGVFVNGWRIDKKKELHDYDFFAVVGYSFYFKKGKLYTSASDRVTIQHFSYEDKLEQKSHLEYPKFNRNTRIQYEIPEIELEIQNPENKPTKPRRNLLISLIPALVMLAAVIILRGLMGGGSVFIIYSAIAMSMGAFMSVATYITEKKKYKEETAERIERYQQYIVEKQEEIEKAREKELEIRNLIYESIENSIQEVHDFGRRLFEKSTDDVDFLQVYLGKGRIESSNQVRINKEEIIDLEDPLARLPEQVSDQFRYIEDAPIISDFHASNGIGVVGKKSDLGRIIKNITLDLAIRHYYGDVKFVYLLNELNVEEMSWVRWLHNVENDDLDVRNIIYDEESMNVLLENLYVILTSREQTKRGKDSKEWDEYYVVFVTDASVIRTHPVSKYIKNCHEYGFTFVFFEEYEEMLPQGCTEIIRMESRHGNVLHTKRGDHVLQFEYPEIPNQIALDIALRLGAVTVDEVSLEGELTKNISMFELLGIMSVEDLNLNDRWETAQVYNSMAAPLGVKRKNEVVFLDISDKAGAHGPHGLVAGTTGSGKSEIIQSYILSMATLYHPYEVGFVIIDFKGGGMANQFKNLPHLIGTITNIDGREINRSLLSIKAELVKRQEMFSDAGVNHINDYIKLFKAKKVDKPLPHLIMVVDEFAELKAEHPDFMKEIISAARIGRTLGIHLILATQKPAGVVDNQIWSNSKFKLCLKVQTREDSTEVIKTPLAAEIVEPGRAYFQVGNNEIFDLFQSAYSGGHVPTGNDMNERIFELYERNIWGKKRLVYSNKKAKTAVETKTQLEAIVEYVHDFCAVKGIEQLPGICLPSLPDVINTNSLDYSTNNELNISVPIGMYDDPEQQRQGQVVIEPSKENVYLVGSAQTGKTTMLQTLTYGLINKYDPSQVNLYLIDCGSMVLKTFENAKHVGGVVLSNEEEKCKNLFKLLNTMVAERKTILSSKGVGSFSAYLDAGFTDIPMVVVVIDNMAAFKEYFPNQADELNSLSREAQGVGISFIITSATSNALNYRTQGNFGRKLVLNCNDKSEYSAAFGHNKQTPKDTAGRGLLMLDKRILEYQVAIFGNSSKEAERSAELKQFIEKRNTECQATARTIPMVPEKLILQEALQTDAEAFKKKGILPIGMDYDKVEYSTLDFNRSGSMTLMGDRESKERFTVNLLQLLSQTIIYHNIEAIIIDDKSKSLQEFSALGFVQKYTNDPAEGLLYVNDFHEEITRRKDLDELEDLSYKLLILNNTEVFKRISSDRNESKSFAGVIKDANEALSFVLITTMENETVGFNASEVLKTIKEEKKAILFAPILESKVFDVPARLRAETTFEKSNGYRFDSSGYTKIKIFE